MIINQGGGGVTSVGATAPVLSSGGLTPTISLDVTGSEGEVLTLTGGVWSPSPIDLRFRPHSFLGSRRGASNVQVTVEMSAW
jgi:hypothetical protein